MAAQGNITLALTTGRTPQRQENVAAAGRFRRVDGQMTAAEYPTATDSVGASMCGLVGVGLMDSRSCRGGLPGVAVVPLNATGLYGRDDPPDRGPAARAGSAGAFTFAPAAPSASDTTPPTFAGISSAVAASASSVTVSWAAATDNVTASGDIWYEVHYATSAAAGWTTKAIQQGGTSLTVTGLTPSTLYYFRVRARDAAGNFSNTSSQAVETSATTSSTTPTFAGATSAVANSATQITVSWAQATDDQTAQADIWYEIHVDTSAGTSFNATRVVKGTGSVAIAGLTPSTTYYFRVRARDAAGNYSSGASQAVEVSAATSSTTPTFAGITGAVTASRTSVTVSWTQATDDTSAQPNIWYEVHFATSAGAGFSPKRVVQGTGSLLVDGLSAGTTYYFRVRARDEAGNYSSGASQAVELSATTTADTAPTFGGIVTATQITKEVVRLTWSAASDDFDAASSLFYSVHQSTSPAASFTEVYRTLPNVTLYDVKGLTAGTTYYFKVRANDTQGNRDTNVVELSVAVTNNPPTFAGIAGVTRVGYNTLRLSWAAGSDDYDLAAQIVYAIHVSTTPASPFSETYRAPPGSTTFDVGGLTIGTTYYFKVRAIDTNGNSDTNVVELSGSCTDVAPTFAGLTGISNPTASSIQVTWAAATDDYTSAGNLIYAIHVSTSPLAAFSARYLSTPGATSFTTDDLPAGTYYFRAKALDQKGNFSTDGGVELSATSTGGADTTPPTFAGLAGISNPTPNQVQLNWLAGSDAVTAAPDLVYAIHVSSSAAQPFNEYCRTPPGDLSITLDLVTAGTYYFRARAVDHAGNYSADGGPELSAASTGGGGGPADVTAPTFAGIVSASTGASSGEVDLTWAAATDNVTAQGNIVYEVHYSSNAGEPFTVRWVTAPGATSVTISGLFAATTYYFKVRARDEAGNVDANVVELSAVSGLNAGDAPQITNVSPVSGTTITATSTISFDVIDLTNPIRRVIVAVTHGSKANVTEVIHDGTEFKGAYQYVSTIETIPNGYRYTLKRTGGWFSSPYFEVFAIDTTGLES